MTPHVRRSALALAVAVGLVLSGCGAAGLTAQARVADSVGRAANGVLPVLVAAYAAEGNAAIAAAPDYAAAVAALNAVEDRWRPVWGDCAAAAFPACPGGAWRALSVAQRAWADAIDRGRDGGTVDAAAALRAAAAAREAYCALRVAVPNARVTWPDVPLLPCTPEVSDGGQHD